MKTGIVLTTINVPTVLEKYIENCELYGHEDVFFVVVGDRKTPPQAASYVKSLQDCGFDPRIPSWDFSTPGGQNETLHRVRRS